MLAALTLAAMPMFFRVVKAEATRYREDAVALARAPLQWDEETWKRVGLIIAADGAAFAADPSIADAVQRNRNHATDEFAQAMTQFGGGRGLQVAGAVLVTGLVTHNPRIREAGRDAVEASLLAAGVITPAIKLTVGRSRPIADRGAYAFEPFGSDESFPSGHATNAFAVASVLAAHSRGWVVPTIAYTVATSVAASRVNDNVHYTSDVIAGAAIGMMVGRSIVARHARERGSRTQTQPVTWMVVPMRGGGALYASASLDGFLARRW